LVLARSLVRPISRLAAAARRLTAGDFSARVEISGQDELASLSQDVNRLAHALDRNRDAQSQWLADVAHELRTPLSVLKGEIQAILDGIRQPTPEAMESLAAECQRLTQLVGDLRQLSLSDAGGLRYEMQCCDLRGLVSDALRTGRPADSAVTIESRLGERDLPIRADANRIDQLIQNLMQNSLRYSDPPIAIRVTLRQQGRHAILLWEDSPPGVPAEEQQQIFQRLFRRDSSRSRSQGGSGLGLAICAQVIAAHDGQIKAQDSDLGGLGIAIQLPLDQDRWREPATHTHRRGRTQDR
jgi:two-component system sensor histidine kinase BaeS